MNKEDYIDHETRIRVQEKLNQIILEKFDNLESRMESRFSFMESRFTAIDSKIDSQFKWTIGVMVTFFGTVILHILKLM